jgi:hypothetical protein
LQTCLERRFRRPFWTPPDGRPARRIADCDEGLAILLAYVKEFLQINNLYYAQRTYFGLT